MGPGPSPVPKFPYGTGRQVRSTVQYAVPYSRQVRTQYRTLTNIDRYQTDIDEYCQFLQERSLFRKACRISFGEFGLWATRCTDLLPICIRMHPYASVCTHTPYLRLVTPCLRLVQHTLSLKKSKSQKIDKNHNSQMCSGAQNRSESNPLTQF